MTNSAAAKINSTSHTARFAVTNERSKFIGSVRFSAKLNKWRFISYNSDAVAADATDLFDLYKIVPHGEFVRVAGAVFKNEHVVAMKSNDIADENSL